jgi:hypothetical protein
MPRARYAGSSADGSAGLSAGAVGSVAVVSAGGGAGAASAGLLAGESSEPPKSRFNQLNMRAMLQGRRLRRALVASFR